MRRISWEAMALTLAALALVALFCLAVPAVAGNPQGEQELAAQAKSFTETWGRHDAKGLAGFFAPEGDLINPFGRIARGHGEIEKLFTDEQTTFMKESSIDSKILWIDWIKPDVAVVTWDSTITNVLGPDGKKMPPFRNFVTLSEVKQDGKWWAVAARPMSPLPPPPPPASK